MNYIEIVIDAIQYIESNLHRHLSLEELASRYYHSPMHFCRIFQAVTNQTVKSYILGRKLSEAAIALRNKTAMWWTLSSSMVSILMNSSPETFKKCFMSPQAVTGKIIFIFL